MSWNQRRFTELFFYVLPPKKLQKRLKRCLDKKINVPNNISYSSMLIYGVLHLTKYVAASIHAATTALRRPHGALLASWHHPLYIFKPYPYKLMSISP